MRFKGNIQRMGGDATTNVPRTDGLFYVDILYSESTSSVDTGWKHYERAAATVTFDEARDIERTRIDELKAQYQDKES